MIEIVLVVLLLLVLAWAANYFLPHPFGLVFALVVFVIALLYLVEAVA